MVQGTFGGVSGNTLGLCGMVDLCDSEQRLISVLDGGWTGSRRTVSAHRRDVRGIKDGCFTLRDDEVTL